MLLLLRSIVVGLVAGCMVLLIGFSPKIVLLRPATALAARAVHTPRPTSRRALDAAIVDIARRVYGPSSMRTHASGATIVDVAGGVSPSSVTSFVKLAPGEHIAQVGEIHVANDVEAGTEIGLQWHGRDSFVDLDVAGPRGHRRVLVLLH